MNKSQCQSPECGQRPTMHFMRAEKRRYVEEVNFCDSHAQLSFRTRYNELQSPLRRGPGQRLSVADGVVFDLDFMWWDELRPEPPWGTSYVELVEAGANRRFGFTIGLFEWCALDIALSQCATPRPTTHFAMSRAIAALGGRLRNIEIDKFVPAQSTYEAKLHIQQMNTTVLVDVRPSDALVLAVITDVPIIVSDAVLARLPGRQG
jgi:bifunctional DNase/RNase